MPRYVCTEDGAAKFWEITVDGASVTVRYGKLGTTGQSKTKTLASAAAAEAEAARLVREKTGKGYVAAPGSESTADAPAAATAAPPGEDVPAAAAPAPTKKRAARKAPTATTDTAVPPFGDLEAKALRRLAAKLEKNPNIDGYKVSKIVRDANGDDYGTVKPILWHLVEHGLLAAEGLKGVLEELDEAPEGGKPETVFAMFARMGPHLAALGKAGWTEYAPGVPCFVDRLMVDAWERDSALFEGREAELDPRLRLALAFVRRRFEREIDPADAEQILDHLAKQLARGEMTGNQGLRMSKDGRRVEHRLNGEAGLLELAARFGAREDFCRRVVKHALAADEPGVRYLQETLRAASISDVAEIFARCFSWGDCARCEDELAYLESRDDSPEALFAAAEEVVPGKTRGKYDSTDEDDEPAGHRLKQRDDLLALGAVRFAAAGKPIPARFEELYRWSALSDVYHPTIPRHLAAFRALPRERALALADGLLAQDYMYSAAVVVLAAHRDDARLRRALEKDRPNGHVGARYWGLHGAAMIPLLEAEMAHLAADKQARRHGALLHCLATAAREGTPVDPAWTRYLRWDSNGPEPLEYWSWADGELRDDALDAFQPDERRRVLQRAATEEPHPMRVLTSRHVAAEDRELVSAIVDQVVQREGARSNYDQIRAVQGRLGAAFVDALCDAVGRLGADAAFLDLLRGPLPHLDHQRVLASVKGKPETLRDLFARLAAAATGPKQRVYALDRDGDDGFSAREGSFSRIGGSVPGLSKEAYPTLRDEPMTPILTLDLDEIPELGARHPDARLLVLFHPDPDGGEDAEDCRLVPVPRSAVPAPGDGAALAVTPIDLPSALFDDGGDLPQELSDLRRQLRKRGGHVLGGPFWIQEADEGTAGFLFELRDGLCDLNLGDAGSLYAYEGGNFIFQCH